MQSPVTGGSRLGLVCEVDFLQAPIEPGGRLRPQQRFGVDERSDLRATELQAPFTEVVQRRFRGLQELAAESLVGDEAPYQHFNRSLCHVVSSDSPMGKFRADIRGVKTNDLCGARVQVTRNVCL